MPNTLSAVESIDIEAVLSFDRLAPQKVCRVLFSLESTKRKVYGFTSGGKDYVLKVYPDNLRYPKKEYSALSICSKFVPNILPELVSYQLKYAPYYLLYRKINGIPLSSLKPSNVTEWIPTIVDIVCAFSKISLRHYGEIVGEYEGAPNTENLHEYMWHITRHWLRTIADSPHKCVVNDLKSFVADKTIPEGMLGTSPSFSHSDLRLENIFLGVNGLTIIDYDNAFSFLPEFDLCKTFIDLQDYGIPVLLDDYTGMIAGSFSVSQSMALQAIMRFYWFVALRKLSYYCRIHDRDRFAIEYQRLLDLYHKYPK
jgi:hypothetical protein